MITTFWVVTKPTDLSVLEDICFQTDVQGLIKQALGGLTPSEVVAATESETQAFTLARFLLKQRDEGQAALTHLISEV